jgi:hypothetical protein
MNCGRGWEDWEKKDPDAHRGTFTRASGRPKLLHWPGNRTVFPGCGIDLGEGECSRQDRRASFVSCHRLVIGLSLFWEERDAIGFRTPGAIEDGEGSEHHPSTAPEPDQWRRLKVFVASSTK